MPMEPSTVSSVADATAAAGAASDGGDGAASSANAAPSAKIDPVTQVQDAIDSLSLSLFEALRGLRDATAPEALVGGGSNKNKPDDPDYDDFLVAYHNREPHAVEVADRAGGRPPQSKEEYLRILARMDFESDVGTANRLAGEILAKSREVDSLVNGLPGMGRTKDEQMVLIGRLIEENREVDRQLEAKHREATRQRDEVRTMLSDVTSRALGIEEE